MQSERSTTPARDTEHTFARPNDEERSGGHHDDASAPPGTTRPASPPTIRILLVDAHARASGVPPATGLAEVALAASRAEARRLLHRNRGALHLILLGPSLPDPPAGWLLEDAARTNPGAPVVSLTDRPGPATKARRALHAAAGILVNTLGPHRQPAAPEASPQAPAAPPAGDASPTQLFEALSPREHEMLQGLAAGLRDKDIAEQLGLALATVRTHQTRLLSKLGVESRLQALVLALRHGIVRVEPASPSAAPPARRHAGCYAGAQR